MNRTQSLVSAFGAGIVALSTLSGVAQTAPAPAPAAAPAAVAPQAIPAKIALIAFEQAVVATNEGQRSVLEVQKKYEPKKAQIDTMSGEVESLKKQLQAAPATMTDEDRPVAAARDRHQGKAAQPRRGRCDQRLQHGPAGSAEQGGAEGLRHDARLLPEEWLHASAGCWRPAEQRALGEPGNGCLAGCREAYNTTSGVAAPPPSAPSSTTPRRTAPAATRPPAK